MLVWKRKNQLLPSKFVRSVFDAKRRSASLFQWHILVDSVLQKTTPVAYLLVKAHEGSHKRALASLDIATSLLSMLAMCWLDFE